MYAEELDSFHTPVYLTADLPAATRPASRLLIAGYAATDYHVIHAKYAKRANRNDSRKAPPTSSIAQ